MSRLLKPDGPVVECIYCRRDPSVRYSGQRHATLRCMKPLTMLGAVLIALGLVALAYQGFTYTTRETVIDLGPIHATADREKTVPLPPILGIVAVGAGVALMVAGVRKRA